MNSKVMNNSSKPKMYKVCLPCRDTYLHQSEDFLFTYTFSGSGLIAINGKTIRIEKNNGFIIARNEKATFKPDKNCSLQMVHVHLSESDVEHYLLHNTDPSPMSANDTCCIRQIPNHLLLQSFAAGIEIGVEQRFRANSQLTFLKIQECINMITFLCPELYSWFSRMNRSQKINLHEFMENNYQENLPLEQMAQAAGRSLSTFRRDFLKEFGMTPGKWLLNKRLDEAYRLITQKKLKPSSFLLELGFESFSHFSRSFKTRFGIQPSLLLKDIGM